MLYNEICMEVKMFLIIFIFYASNTGFCTLSTNYKVCFANYNSNTHCKKYLKQRLFEYILQDNSISVFNWYIY